MDRVQKVEDLNKEIIQYCERLDKTVDTCIQKIGIVRYNAFKDVGSNLSFTLALLDNNNNGVVLNGIYSRDNSNKRKINFNNEIICLIKIKSSESNLTLFIFYNCFILYKMHNNDN